MVFLNLVVAFFGITSLPTAHAWNPYGPHNTAYQYSPPRPGGFEDYQVELFDNETQALDSSIAKNCDPENPCILVNNGYNETLQLWPEPREGGLIKFRDEKLRIYDEPLYPNQFIYLPGKKTMLIPGPPIPSGYSMALRAFRDCSKKGDERFTRCGPDNVVTKMEWTQNYRVAEKWLHGTWYANIALGMSSPHHQSYFY